MNIIKLLQLPLRYRPWRSAHLRLILADLSGPAQQPARSDREHLDAVIQWLCRAQDIRDGQADQGGVSAGWSFEDGWLPSYPETSGYIVETLLAASKLLEQPQLVQRTQRILDWELSLQTPDGAYPGHFGERSSQPVIFNTGQIIHGMIAGYQQLGRQDCLESAVRAGHWMCSQQDDDGCWRRSVHNDIPHTYNSRAAWALLNTGLAAADLRLQNSAIANLEWALSQQTCAGWYQNNAFTTERPPFTHNIAYAMRGLLEAGLASGQQRFIDSAITAAQALARVQRPDGSLAGTYADNWEPRSSYCCLTGLAQTALIWMRLANDGQQADMNSTANAALDYLKRCHRIDDKDPRVQGGVAGSAPIWGRYSMFEYPNWAAKFFADALMMRISGDVIPAPVHKAAITPEALAVDA